MVLPFPGPVLMRIKPRREVCSDGVESVALSGIDLSYSRDRRRGAREETGDASALSQAEQDAFGTQRSLVGGVVGMAGEDSQRPVDLLGEHRPRKFVWQGDRSKGEEEVCPGAGRVRPAIGRTNGEDEGLNA